MSTPYNPLSGPNSGVSNPLGWPSGTNPSNVPSATGANGIFPGIGTPTFGTPSMMQGVPTGNPGGLPNPWSNAKDAIRNLMGTNVVLGQQRSQLIPQFANAMFGAAGPASQYFGTLMNLGAPYYQQQQRASFENAVNQYQNAAAQARQQALATGQGYGPSGANVGMMGGLAAAQGQNLTQQYLQNLFQNEALQMQGAQGLSGMASMFNPAQLMGQVSVPGSDPTQGPQYGSQILGGLLGGLGFSSGGFSL